MAVADGGDVDVGVDDADGERLGVVLCRCLTVMGVVVIDVLAGDVAIDVIAVAFFGVKAPICIFDDAIKEGMLFHFGAVAARGAGQRFRQS